MQTATKKMATAMTLDNIVNFLVVFSGSGYTELIDTCQLHSSPFE